MLRKIAQVTAVISFAMSATWAQADETVKIGYSTGSLAFLPMFAAISTGAFEEQGITPELVRTGSGSKTVASLVGGSADVIIGATPSILFARKEGLDLKMLSALVTQYSSSIVYSKAWAEQQGVTADSGYDDMLKALKGARIGTSGPGGGDHIIRYFAQEAGLNPDTDLTIVYLGNDIGVYQAAMEQGRIDGISLSAPTPQVAMKHSGAIMAFNTGAGKVESLNGFLYIVATTRADWLEANPETAQKVDKAFDIALATIRNPELTNAARDKVHAEFYADTDKEVFDAVWGEFAVGAPESTSITKEALMRVVEFTNSFEKDNPIDPSTVEGSFVE